jgi:NADPH2:quinone reductase
VGGRGGRALRAAVIADRRLAIVERDTPEPTADQVLVEMAGAGVNRADLLQRMGRYPAPPGWPDDIPGLEFAGTIVAVGDRITGLETGERVFGIVGGGGHATHVLTREDLCALVPEGLDLVEAGGVPEVYVTAHDALVTQGGLRPGNRVLIHGVGSGVGTAAVQIANRLGAATVGTSRTPEKLEMARELGLDEPVLASDDMAARIEAVDVVIDLVGGSYVELDLEVCKPSGKVILVGLLAGASANVDLGLLMRKRLTVRGTTLRNRPEHEKAAAVSAFAKEIVPLLAHKALKPTIDRVMPFEQANEAYDIVGSNSTFGKVVISPGVR